MKWIFGKIFKKCYTYGDVPPSTQICGGGIMTLKMIINYFESTIFEGVPSTNTLTAKTLIQFSIILDTVISKAQDFLQEKVHSRR